MLWNSRPEGSVENRIHPELMPRRVAMIKGVFEHALEDPRWKRGGGARRSGNIV